MILPLIYCLFGIFLLLRCGDWFVDAAGNLAEIWGMPKFLVGATVVALATSLPEILVSIFAAYQGISDLAVGNAVGTVSANIGLILGISLVFLPDKIGKRQLFFQGILLVLTPVALVIWGPDGLSTGECLLIFGLFILFLWENTGFSKENPPPKEVPAMALGCCLFFFLVGGAGIAFGSRLLVDNGTVLAGLLGVSPRVIAVTLVSVGTALPELVTTLTAVRKGQTALSVGNVLGASILDLTTILPISALVSPGILTFSAENLAVDLPMCILLGLVAVVPPLVKGRFYRWQGGALLGLYGGYLTFSLLT
ncbi:MAG: sodium:calcium antiporter [Eubacteriales bacterium]